MFVYTAALVPVSLLPCVIGLSGAVYGAGALVLGLLFLASAIRVIRDTSGDTSGDSGGDTGERAARRMFPFSILYLFLIFVLLLVDQNLPVEF
jgi:protoheme IX farnesyltransferase